MRERQGCGAPLILLLFLEPSPRDVAPGASQRFQTDVSESLACDVPSDHLSSLIHALGAGCWALGALNAMLCLGVGSPGRPPAARGPWSPSHHRPGSGPGSRTLSEITLAILLRNGTLSKPMRVLCKWHFGERVSPRVGRRWGDPRDGLTGRASAAFTGWLEP